MSALARGAVKVVTFIAEVIERFIDDDGPQLAAATAYYAIFALPPLLILFMITAGRLVDVGEVEAVIHGGAIRFISPGAAEQLLSLTRRANEWAHQGAWWSVGLSILGLLYAATRAFDQLQTALNRAWALDETARGHMVREFLLKRLVSFLALTVMIVFLFVLLVLRALLDLFSLEAAAILPQAILPVLDWVTGSTLSLAAGAVFLAAIYRYLPDTKITWRQVIPGALVTALLFEATKSLIRFYLVHASVDIFGQAASFAVLMLWLYVSASLLFAGAEFTEIWARRNGRPIGLREKRHSTPDFTRELERVLLRYFG